MNFQILVFVALFSFNLYSTEAKDNRGQSHREGKCILDTIFSNILSFNFPLSFAVFSLFNIVTFKNDGCRSTSTTR